MPFFLKSESNLVTTNLVNRVFHAANSMGIIFDDDDATSVVMGLLIKERVYFDLDKKSWVFKSEASYNKLMMIL